MLKQLQEQKTLYGFTNSKSPMQAAKIENTLSLQFRYNIGNKHSFFTSRRNFILWALVNDYNTIYKNEYRIQLDNSYFTITKTEYDFFNYLKNFTVKELLDIAKREQEEQEKLEQEQLELEQQEEERRQEEKRQEEQERQIKLDNWHALGLQITNKETKDYITSHIDNTYSMYATLGNQARVEMLASELEKYDEKSQIILKMVFNVTADDSKATRTKKIRKVFDDGQPLENKEDDKVKKETYTEKQKQEYKDKQANRVENAYNKLMDMFTSGKFPEAAARTLIEKQAGDTKPSNNWSWLNYIIMLSNETSDARTFKQWQAVGRKVNKGAKAIYILAPNTFKIKDEDTEEEIFITRSFRPIAVFRYEDTNGLELKQHDYTQPNHKTAIQVAERLGIKVNYKPFTGKAYGFYVPSTKEITMMSNDEKTLWHELGHAVDDKLGYLAKSKEAEQEIVAEMVAAIMTQLRGITGYEQHSYNYIKNYGSMQALAKLINRIFKIVEILLNEQDQVEKQAI